jgi:iron complex transport system substrate-binding protein
MPGTIASLLASGTEIVCALGLRERLVGISHECDFPPDVRSLPVLTASRVDATAPSSEIDRSVRARAASGLSLYEIFADRLRALEPDLIVTQDQCRVCAVSLAQVEAEVRDLIGKAARIVSLQPHSLSDALDDVVRVAEAAGSKEAGARLRAWLRDRLNRLSSRANCSAGHQERRNRVLCLEWLDPPFLSGHWMPELVEVAGGEPASREEAAASQRAEWAELGRLEPDVIVLMPCGFDLERTLREAPSVLARPEVRDTQAFRSGEVWAVDGSAYFNRSGPRLVESAEILAAILHPGTFGAPPAEAARRLLDPERPAAAPARPGC